ncbi:MAG: primary-amine oxidase [Cystobacter sp.]
MKNTTSRLGLTGLLMLGAVSCSTNKGTGGTERDGATQAPAPAAHPLDAFTQAEFAQALQLMRAHGHVTEHTLFPLVVPSEPSKQELESFQTAGTPVPRRLLVVTYDTLANETHETQVRLTSPAAIERRAQVPGVQPPLGTWDADTAKAVILEDPRFQAALRRRGVTRSEDLYFDTWAMGPSPTPQRANHRLVKTLFFFKGNSAASYARPVEGLLAFVDLTRREVVELTDRGDIPIPPGEGAYDERSVGPLRPRPRPLLYSRPEGDNITLTGNEVRWQNWRFRVDAHPREGAVLQGVTYTDQGRERKVLHRLSLSEMVVPYGDPEDTWSWRSAFDVGEYGFAGRASPLEPGGEVPADARFLPAVYVDPFGQVQETPRALSVYERDGGVLWKHYDPEAKHNEVRRGLELVVAFSVVIENYDYLLQYVFKQDGSMQVDVLLTGIMLARAVPPRTAHDTHAGHEPYGHQVADGVVAVHHQHFFNFRLDLDVDGPRNSVMELNSSALPVGPANLTGNAFSMRMEPLASELQARRDMSLAQARRWLVINPQAHNALGQPTGYALVPGENAVPYAAPDNRSRQRAGFIEHAFWATRHAPGELNAAGAYPNQSQGGEGLPTWVQEDQSLLNEDVVVWYTLGVTHTPRPEEWPVMPTAHAGFRLLPVGFFTRNPALDLPATPPSP